MKMDLRSEVAIIRLPRGIFGTSYMCDYDQLGGGYENLIDKFLKVGGIIEKVSRCNNENCEK